MTRQEILKGYLLLSDEEYELIYDMTETLQSLNRSIKEAGGSFTTYKALESMTALDFLLTIAPNKIRFVRKGKYSN